MDSETRKLTKQVRQVMHEYHSLLNRKIRKATTDLVEEMKRLRHQNQILSAQNKQAVEDVARARAAQDMAVAIKDNLRVEVVKLHERIEKLESELKCHHDPKEN